MTKSPTEERTGERSGPQEPRFGPKRSFARGLVLAVPVAILLWGLVVWLVT